MELGENCERGEINYLGPFFPGKERRKESYIIVLVVYVRTPEGKPPWYMSREELKLAVDSIPLPVRCWKKKTTKKRKAEDLRKQEVFFFFFISGSLQVLAHNTGCQKRTFSYDTFTWIDLSLYNILCFLHCLRC